jgi:hypothetical protein
LAPLATAYPSMNVCQIHNLWEQYDNHLVPCTVYYYWRLYVKYNGRGDAAYHVFLLSIKSGVSLSEQLNAIQQVYTTHKLHDTSTG